MTADPNTDATPSSRRKAVCIVHTITHRDRFSKSVTAGRYRLRAGQSGKGGYLHSCSWSGDLGRSLAFDNVRNYARTHHPTADLYFNGKLLTDDVRDPECILN